jgi:amylosucrase
MESLFMANNHLVEKQALTSLTRLRPRLEERFANYADSSPQEWQVFLKRLDENFPNLFKLLLHLYGNQYDFFFHLEDLLTRMAASWINRAQDLKQLDAEREADPTWFQSNNLLGGVCYVDLFAGDLSTLRTKIPYFKELGLTYLHLMPLFQVCQKVRTTEDMRSAATEKSTHRLGNHARSLQSWHVSCAGTVLAWCWTWSSTILLMSTNGPSEPKQGKSEYQNYYRMYPDRTSCRMPYEVYLREIFPDEHPWRVHLPDRGIKRWVWTTFHSYQWDLNYNNPVVFNQMADEMLFLANAGVEILRLDAVAFTWKQLGTSCENLPEAHMLIQAFNAVSRIAAPSLLFKSEAIVHPDDVSKYISPDECQLSYNPLLMALLWNSLATREVRLLKAGL